MSMIWLYVFLLDFLIPFLCDPDLQCVMTLHTIPAESGGSMYIISIIAVWRWNTEYTLSGICHFGVHSIPVEKLAQPGDGGGCSATRSLYLLSRTKLMWAEGRYCIPLFILYPYMNSERFELGNCILYRLPKLGAWP